MTKIISDKFKDDELLDVANKLKKHLKDLGVRYCSHVKFPILAGGRILFTCESILTVEIEKDKVSVYSTEENNTDPIITLCFDKKLTDFEILKLKCEIGDYICRKKEEGV